MIPLLKSIFRHIFDALNSHATWRRQTKLCFHTVTKEIYGHDIWTVGESSAAYVLFISLEMDFHCTTGFLHWLYWLIANHIARDTIFQTKNFRFRLNHILFRFSSSKCENMGQLLNPHMSKHTSLHSIDMHFIKSFANSNPNG